MDDDMLWTRDTDVDSLLRVFKETKADLITMSIAFPSENDRVPENYTGDLYSVYNQTDDTWTKIFCLHEFPPPLVPEDCGFSDSSISHKRSPINYREGCYDTDIGLMTFFSTRDFLLDNPHHGVIGQEHVPWFWRMKNQTKPAKIVGCYNIRVVHSHTVL